MDEYGQGNIHAGNWRRRVFIALAILFALLLIFHRPLLLYVARRVALHYAAKEHLKLEFQLEGSVLTNLTVKNLRAVPTGPTDIESVDIDLAHVDYSLFTLLRHGISTAIENLDTRSARVVINPAKAPSKPPNPKKKIELPDIFPERVHVSDLTVVVRGRPKDFVAEHADVDLDPHRAGTLRIGKLQLVGGQIWSGLSAKASYANRDLIVHDLVLADDEKVRLLEIDGSRIISRQLVLKLEYAAGQGQISASSTLRESHSSIDGTSRVRAEKFPIEALNKCAGLPEGSVRGQIEELELDLSGLLNSPKSWNGNLDAQIGNFHNESGIAFDRGVFQIASNNGVAAIHFGKITQDKNEINIHGAVQLPATVQDLGRTPATLKLAATLPDLGQVTEGFPRKISGSADISGDLEINNSVLSSSFALKTSALKFEDGQVENLNATVTVTRKMAAPESNRPWFADLKSKADLTISAATFRDYAADSIHASTQSVDDLVTFERLEIQRKQNEFAATGQYRLPKNLRDWTRQRGKIDITFHAPELGDYWVSDSPDKITGPLNATGQIETNNGAGNGWLSIFGSNLQTRDLVFNEIDVECQIWNNVVYLNDLRANLNENDFVAGNGIVDLHPPFHYTGKLRANVSDLSKLQPLLRSLGNQDEIGGSIALDWEGRGEASKFKNSGKLKFALENGRYANARSLQAKADAIYSREGLNVPTIFLRSDQMYFQAIAQTQDDTLEISKIELDQAHAKYASGYISVPFIWKNLGSDSSVFPSNGKVAATFQSENLDIQKLFQDVGLKPAASGLLSVKFDAGGTLADLDARLNVQMRDLRTERLPKLEPASFDLAIEANGKKLTAAGKLQQAKIQPIELNASLPFDVPKIVREGNLADDTPVDAKIRMPRSSVNFLRQFVPGVEELDGDAALDVGIAGTIGRPVLTGSGDMTINVARMTDPTLPAVQNFKARLNFANDALTLERFGGELSGGHFTVGGRITLPKLTAVDLDLQLKADSALIARNDTLTMRADADIKVMGPLSAANVTGNIGITNSRVLKNLDLLPIGLPGRPAPEPPAAQPQLSFPDPPLRDWKFDVAIKTKSPVLLRGNLATGGAVVNLHLGGTGLHPGLDGFIRLENVEATLPFSRLQISYGFLYFDPGDSLNPKLELHGTSVIRDYTIHVYVYGTLDSPQAVFNSEPPLPQEEIISLLATGTTREELTGNNNVLAGRAAMLLVQQLYRKIFKKGQGTQNTSVFDRLDVDIGTVDPRTGQQQATARFKINNQFVVVGNIGVGGDYRGMVKYLIRFR